MNENYKNLKKIYSNKIGFGDKKIVRYYKLDAKNTKICTFCNEKHKHIHIHGYYSKCLKKSKINNFTEVFNIRITIYLCAKCKKTFSDKYENQYQNYRITQNFKCQILEDFKKNTVFNDLKAKYNLPFLVIKSVFKNHIKQVNLNKIDELRSSSVENLSIDEKKLVVNFIYFY